MRIWLASLVLAAGAALVAAAAGAAPITPADFGGTQLVENFEGIGLGPNVASSAFGNIVLPGSTSTFTFVSGVSLLGPNPGLFSNGAFLHNTGAAGAVNGWGANGTVGTPADVPDPWGQPSSTYLGVFDNLGAGGVVLDLSFGSDVHQVGAWVAGMAGTLITLEVYDASNTLLETSTLAAPSVAAWGTSFLGLERAEGIRRVVFRGSDFGIDGLTFDATPLIPLPEARLGALMLVGIAYVIWRGR